MQIYEEYFSLLLENLMLVETQPANEKIRIKRNYKPKENNKGKENNAIFFKTWQSL